MRVAVALGLLLLSVLLPVATAQEEPLEVQVGLHILSVGNYEFASGSFEADAYVWFEHDASLARNFTAAGFQVQNGDAEVTRLSRARDNGIVVEEFLVTAELHSRPRVERFPFDTQSLRIVIEDPFWNGTTVRYVPRVDASGVEENVSLVGWRLHNWTLTAEPKEYGFGANVTRLVFSMNFERSSASALINSFLPPTLFALIAALAFGLAPTGVPERVGITTGALIASVFFHTSTKTRLPPSPSLILFDQFMIAVYTFIFGAGLVVVLSAGAVRSPRIAEKWGWRINGLGAIATLVATFLVAWLVGLLDA